MRGIDGSRQLTFRYELLDNNDKKIRDLDEVISGKVTQNNLGVIKRRASFELSDTDDIDFLNNRIKPYVRLDMSQIRFPVQPRQPKLAALQDTFTELPPPDEWVSYSGGATNTLDGLELPADTSASIETDTAWGLLGTFVRVQLTGVLDPTGATEAYTQVVVEGPDAGDSLSITHNAISDEIEFEALSNSSSVASGAETYSSTDHQFLRIFEEDRTTSFQTSPSGWDGTWTTQVSLDTPQWVTDNNSSLKLTFEASRDGGDADAAYWMNLNSGDTRSLLEPNKKYVEWPLGIFLMSSPSQEADEVGSVTRSVEGFDKTQVYTDDRITERLSTATIKYINDDFDRVEDLEGEWGDLETGESWNFIPYEVT